jgi:hypothetical protein
MSFLIFINMGSKICCNCKLLKTANEFHKNKSKKDGLQETCKECRKLSAQKNKEILSDYKKNWYQKNSEVRKKKANIRYSIKKDEINEKRRHLYNNDDLTRKKIKDQHTNYYQKNKELVLEKTKIWAKENKDKRSEIMKKHYNRYKTLMACRRLIKRTIKYLNTTKDSSTIDILGYSPSQLKETIESKFTKGMTWENYGEWHIDHIRPISSFNKDTEPKIINALSNLQPLWAKENLSKGNRY